MLKVYFGDMENSIYIPSTFFDNTYEEEWFDDEIVRKMVLDIDKSVVLSKNCIQSPVLGQIAPVTISGGVKTLILMYKVPEEVFNASQCGDNCAKWILKIAKLLKKDLLINLNHIMDFGKEPFEIFVDNTNKVAHNMKELIIMGNSFLE